jgi:branched-subunit amino acid aminotransferase/4-amino-4-deoxychorismate lyase
MTYTYFSQNGQILPLDKATIPLTNIEYTYGFGVYETIRVSNGMAYFVREHTERLMASAKVISLEHTFSADKVEEYLQELIEKAELESCNLKILLIGATTKEAAQLYILPLNPLFPDRKLYREGVDCITYQNERLFPHAKTLNMLPSYLAYRQAKAAGAYEALLINQKGCITEGTRTNFLAIKDKTIVSPPEDEILLGVMRKVVLKVALANGFTLEQKDIPLQPIQEYDGAFISSTSTKLMPIRSIDSQELDAPTPLMQELVKRVDQFLSASKGLFD